MMVMDICFFPPSAQMLRTAWSRVARPYSAQRERVWDMAIEQFVAPHRGVRTNHSTVFSHMIPDVINGKIQISV